MTTGSVEITSNSSLLKIPLIRCGLNVLSLVGAACLLVIDLYVLLHMTINENVLVVAAANNFAFWLLLATLPCLAITLLAPKWRWRRALLALPALGMLVFSYGGYFLPKTAAALAEDGFTIATFNATAEINDPALAPDRASAILALDADIIGIQEFDFPARYIPLLESAYPHHFTPDELIGTGRDMPYALFSRFPIDHDQLVLIGDLPTRQRPVAARFIVTIDGQPYSIYVMHSVKPDMSLFPPGYDGVERGDSTRDVADAVAQETNPVILLCDCNMSDQTADYGALSGVLLDAWREEGLGFGFTVPAVSYRSPFPVLRGDYIWHSSSLQVLAIRVAGENGGSDHFPIIAQMALP